MTPPMLIDSHVNLHHEAFGEDRAEAIARARAAGVGVMVTICDKMENAPVVRAVAAIDPDIYATVGAHPHYAKDHLKLTAEELIAHARDPKIVGIGETGLDLHYGFSPIGDQLTVFRAHVEAARATDLPLIVHTRQADDLTGDLLEEEWERGPFRLLMHCYTSGERLARRALALGATISFSGIMTFKNAHDVRAIAELTPLDRVILETDCPYLAPVPHRGRRCEPAHVAEVYAAFAALRSLPVSECAERIRVNFHRLFHTIPAKAAA
jgi:TatD DNase family protein